MIKKYIIKYDELGKPIEIVELKEFTDTRSLEEFKRTWDANKSNYLKRLKEKAENEQKEKEKTAEKIETLQKEKESLKLVISHILGYKELSEEEIKEVLGGNWRWRKVRKC